MMRKTNIDSIDRYSLTNFGFPKRYDLDYLNVEVNRHLLDEQVRWWTNLNKTKPVSISKASRLKNVILTIYSKHKI